MLRPGYRLLGGRHFDGDTAVRRGRLCSTRKVIFAKNKNHKWKSRREDGQLDFAKMSLTQSHKGRCLFASMQIGTLEWISAAVWAASSAGWSTLRHLDCATEIQLRRGRLHLKRGLQGAHHHLHDSLRWYLSLSLPVRLFFQFVFKVQYISTHHKRT